MPSLKCRRAPCRYCLHIIEADKWPVHDSQGYVYIHDKLCCQSSNVFFVFFCNVCQMKIASYSHEVIQETLLEILKDSLTEKPISNIGQHAKRCGFDKLSLLPIAQFTGDEQLKEKILTWIATTMCEKAHSYFQVAPSTRFGPIKADNPDYKDVEIDFGSIVFKASINKKSLTVDSPPSEPKENNTNEIYFQELCQKQQKQLYAMHKELNQLKATLNFFQSKPQLSSFPGPSIHFFDGINVYTTFSLRTHSEVEYFNLSLNSLKNNVLSKKPLENVYYDKQLQKNFFHFMY